MDEPIEPALEAALLAHPDDDTSVYGDWLAERGHPRGELIAVQHALAVKRAQWLAGAPVDDEALRERERRLFVLHADALLPFPSDEGRELEWNRGFIKRAKLFGHDPEGALERLLAHPSARFLRELEVFVPDVRDTLAILLDGPPLPLDTIQLGDEPPDDPQPITAELGAKFPRLAELIVSGTPPAMHELPASLVALDVPLTQETAHALAHCALPALAAVALDLADLPGRVLEPFFARGDLPALRAVVTFGRDSSTIADLLVASPFAAQLERVEVHGAPSDVTERLRSVFGDRWMG